MKKGLAAFAIGYACIFHTWTTAFIGQSWDCATNEQKETIQVVARDFGKFFGSGECNLSSDEGSQDCAQKIFNILDGLENKFVFDFLAWVAGLTCVTKGEFAVQYVAIDILKTLDKPISDPNFNLRHYYFSLVR